MSGRNQAPAISYLVKAKGKSGSRFFTVRRSLRIEPMKLSRWLCSTHIAAMSMLCACAASQGLSQKPAPAPSPPSNHIFVTGGDLDSECYQDLGQIALNESYTQSVVDSPDSQAQRLRQLAQDKYASKVDAIIKVRDQQNDAGTAVEISGEAVHLQNHETVACAVRAMPPVIDSASAAAGGGIVGTVAGGLMGNGGNGSVYGAEAGGAFCATVAAGQEIVKRQQQKQAEQAFISDRLQQQQTEIAQLYQQLTKLIGQQCDSEELSEQDCEQRIVAVQQQIAIPAGPAQAAGGSANGEAAGNNSTTTEFGVLNRIQEQQELIDQLQQRIAQIKQRSDDQ